MFYGVACPGRGRRGRLRPGDALPGSRALAQSLGVHRNTVLAACAELTAEGWIFSEPGELAVPYGSCVRCTGPNGSPCVSEMIFDEYSGTSRACVCAANSDSA